MSVPASILSALIFGAAAGYLLNRIALLYLLRYTHENIVYGGFVGTLMRKGENKHPYAADMVMVEAAASLLSGAALMLWSGTGLVFNLLIVYLILLLSFIDSRIRILPNQLNLAGIVIGSVYAFFRVDFTPADALLGMVTGGGFAAVTALAYHFARGREGLGLGDVKLLVFFGSFAGWEGVLLIIIGGSLPGAVWGLYSASKEEQTLNHEIPFGPFLGLGALGYLFLFI